MSEPARPERVDWARLLHAYGTGADAPEHLRALVGTEPDARRAALAYLNGAVLHQGTVFPVTPPVVRVIVTLLGDPALRRDDGEGRPVLADVVGWLGWVGAGTAEVEPDVDRPAPTPQEWTDWYALLDSDDDNAWDSPVMDAAFNAALIELRSSAPLVIEALAPLVHDETLAVRSEAAGALARWATLSGTTPVPRRS